MKEPVKSNQYSCFHVLPKLFGQKQEVEEGYQALIKALRKLE